MFSICRCDTYVYVINMQMCEICVCLSYADAKHMDMHGICMFLSFFTGIRKSRKPDLCGRERAGDMIIKQHT